MALTGHHLLVAADTWQPYVKFPKEAETGNGSLSGAAYDTFALIARKLNFTYDLVRPVDGLWGSRNENGSFNGMVGMLERQEVDMALGPFIINYEREQVVDFSDILIIDSFGIFLPRPTVQQDLSSFLKPLSSVVWSCLLVAVVASAGTGLVLQWLAERGRLPSLLPPSQGSATSSKHLTPVVFRLDWLVRALCGDAIVDMPRLATGRMMLGTWLIVSLVMSAAYCGALTSLLAVPNVSIPVDSLEDLVRSDIPFAVEKGGALFQLFMAAESGVMKEAADRMGSVSSCYYSRFEIKYDNMAVICDYISMRKVISEEFSANATCGYYIARERLAGGSLAFTFQKKSPYKRHFDQCLRSLTDGGIPTALIAGYTPNVTACLVPPGSEPGQVKVLVYSVNDLGGVFLLCLGGMAISLTVLIAEVLVSNWKKRPTAD